MKSENKSKWSFVILTPRFEVTRGLFRHRPDNFEPQSDDEMIPELAHPLQASLHSEDVWHPMYDLTCNRPTCTADLQGNRVSRLEPSDPEAETLPIGHHCPINPKEKDLIKK
ncbi:hypothetical protein AVEN_210739-1 [Araneus ventricosus]|uniref:Uncharacterized protein n=1 Tax=Araneus ventricosus TaxID=182803 RepID=A0A4Y2UL66_ARAVE|nr:hypothetical protein AVEN_210739-1 [Araneus ventricosus]